MSEHPANPKFSLGKSRIWYGPEVEGRLAKERPFTAFISAPLEPPELAKLAELIIDERKVQHVFLTEIFDGKQAWGWFEHVLLGLTEHVGGLPITIARWGAGGGRGIEEVFERASQVGWLDKVTLLVRADEKARWMTLLRPQDQLSVGCAYDLVTWSVGDGVRTVPTDYKDDSA